MKRLRQTSITPALLGAVVLLASGCSSLSLLSHRHVHYHASDEADKKIDALEQRVEALEKAIQKK
jgi:hypothetical protein